jgi:hypothetical protein
MNTFDDAPTTDLVTELLARIEHSNGLDFVPGLKLLRLLHALNTHLTETPKGEQA